MTSVLIVDDEPAIRDLMGRWTAALGLSPTTAANADEALATLEARECALAFIDVRMPGHDGLWLARQIERDHPHTAVVFATGYAESLNEEHTKLPMADVLLKPILHDRFLLALERGRRWHRQAVQDIEWHTSLSNELQERTDAICAEVMQQATLGHREADTLVRITAARAPDVLAHSERVARSCDAVARELSLDARTIERLHLASRFHDVGKIALPEALLTKPSPLTSGEQAVVRRHVDAGAAILSSTHTLHHLASLVMASHEWAGGGGYPLRIAGAAIPLPSRIIGVVDAYDAMTQDRHYRTRLDSAEAVSELLRCAGTQFDAKVVNAFLAVLGE